VLKKRIKMNFETGSRSWEPGTHMDSGFLKTEHKADTPTTEGSGLLEMEPKADIPTHKLSQRCQDSGFLAVGFPKEWQPISKFIFICFLT
jgi:hypothetical protein